MRASPYVAFAIALSASPASALTYSECVRMAETDPDRALVVAREWVEETAAAAARHCEAIALAEVGAASMAARALEDLSGSPELDEAARADILLQAAALWRGEGEAAAARAALDGSLDVRPTARALIERAALNGDVGDWSAARADLDRALSLDPENGEAVALRAAAHRRLGDVDAALADAERAVQLLPERPISWLELGMAERALGRNDAARRSWLRAIDLDPGDPSAAMARGALQDMDGGG